MATVPLGFVHTSTNVQHYYHISIFVHTQLMNKPLSGHVRELKHLLMGFVLTEQ